MPFVHKENVFKRKWWRLQSITCKSPRQIVLVSRDAFEMDYIIVEIHAEF
jgi:hypothetical protein